MAILKIEEKVKELSREASWLNLQNLKEQVRLAWQRGDEVNLNKFLALFPLLKKEEDLYIDWFQTYSQVTFIDYYLDEEINEIVFHDYQTVSLLKRQTREFKKITFLDKEDFKLALELLARRNSQSFNYLNPFVSFTINRPNFSLRISLTHESISPLKTHKVFIRIMRKEEYSLKSYINNFDLIKKAILERKNILIAGATGSGKTSFIKTLLSDISHQEHTIVIEDTHELKSTQSHFTHMLARENIKIDDLLTYALRMTPDRLIVGEVRSHEVITSILALNTGHKGFMTSLHANNALDALHRMTLLFNLYSSGHPMKYQDVLNLVVKNIDLVIYLKDKKVFEIIEPHSSEANTIYHNKINLELASCN